MIALRKIRHEYSDLGMSVQEVIFDNGLTVHMVPRPHFKEKQVLLAVPFGSTSCAVSSENNDAGSLLGLAHFLEHKMFEMGEGKDALEEFTALGVEANAFTTYQQTVYYFSTVNQINDAITHLLQLIAECHFTEESVDRERSIIKNELLTYEDDSDYQMGRALLANLYPHSALSYDIAGNKESIDRITASDLMRAHQNFYAFNQLNMVIVGDFDVDKAVNEVDNFVKNTVNKEFDKRPINSMSLNTNPQEVVNSSRLVMDVAQPKLGLGFRILKELEGVSLTDYKLGLRLFLAMVFGWTSETYQDWYDKGIIDYTFDYHLEVTQSYSFVTMTLDTNQPIAMTRNIKRLLQTYSNHQDFSEEHLSLLKKEMYGDFISSLDSIDHLAHNVTLSLADGADYLATGDAIRRISLSDVKTIADHFVSNMEATTVTIFPK